MQSSPIAVTGRIDVRFADTTLIDLAAGGTPVDLEFAYTLSAQAKLVLTAGTGEAKDALAQMGIALRDQSGNLRRSEDLLADVADAFAKIEDPAERVRLAFGQALDPVSLDTWRHYRILAEVADAEAAMLPAGSGRAELEARARGYRQLEQHALRNRPTGAPRRPPHHPDARLRQTRRRSLGALCSASSPTPRLGTPTMHIEVR